MKGHTLEARPRQHIGYLGYASVRGGDEYTSGRARQIRDWEDGDPGSYERGRLLGPQPRPTGHGGEGLSVTVQQSANCLGNGARADDGDRSGHGLAATLPLGLTSLGGFGSDLRTRRSEEIG